MIGATALEPLPCLRNVARWNAAMPTRVADAMALRSWTDSQRASVSAQIPLDPTARFTRSSALSPPNRGRWIALLTQGFDCTDTDVEARSQCSESLEPMEATASVRV